MAINKIILNTDNGDQVLVDLSGDNVVEDALVVGYTAHGADGEPVAGGNPYEKTATDAEVQAQGGLIDELKSAIAENVGKTTAEVDTQADLIDQIKTALEGKAGGGVQLPSLDNPGSAGDMAEGKQLIGADGKVVTGNLPVNDELTSIWTDVFDSGSSDYFSTTFTAEEAMILKEHASITAYVQKSQYGDARPEDVAQGVVFTSENGVRIEGTVEDGRQLIPSSLVSFHYEDGAVMADYTFGKDALYRRGEKLQVVLPDLGNAQPENVAQGVTFTSDNGLKIEGTAVMGGGGATVKTATARPTANSTSISFAGLTGMPKMFSICPTGNVTFNTSNRFIVNVMYDGATTRGIYAAGSGSWNATYTGTHSATYFTWEYNNGTLTIRASSATNGGYFAANVTYQLTYAV